MCDRTIFQTAPLFFSMLSPTVDKLLYTPRKKFFGMHWFLHFLDTGKF